MLSHRLFDLRPNYGSLRVLVLPGLAPAGQGMREFMAINRQIARMARRERESRDLLPRR